MVQISKFIPGTVSNALRRDLKRLNQLEAGLGEKALSYVTGGSDATVLSTIAVKAKGNPLDVLKTYYFTGDEKTAQSRVAYFLDADPFDVQLLARYANVLAASCNPLPESTLGSDQLSPAFRVYFSEAMVGARDPQGYWPARARETPIKGLTWDKLIPAAEAMGADAADVFELLYWETSNYGMVDVSLYRDLTDIKALITQNPEAALEGAARTQAQGRAAFVSDLAKQGLVGEEPYLSTVLDYAGESAKAVRETALKALRSVSPNLIEAKALDRLAKGTVSMRAGMVSILAGLETDTARAALMEHAKTEKTARIKAAIENALSVTTTTASSDHTPDDATGYTAIDGSRVEVPPLKPLSTGTATGLSAADKATLLERIEEQNKKTEAWNRENKGRKYFYKQPMIKTGVIGKIDAMLAGERLKQQDHWEAFRIISVLGENIIRAHMADMPEEHALKVAFNASHNFAYWCHPHAQGPFASMIQDYLASPDADLRAIDALWCDANFELSVGGWRSRDTRLARKGDVLRTMIPEEPYSGTDPADVPQNALWPYVADNFDVLDHAFGIGSGDDLALDRVRGVACIAAMPKVPMRYFGPLLEIATGERKSGKAEARKLLTAVPEVDDRLVALLDDTRQAVRAGAADWIGTRATTSAIPALKKRLKKEKSELAKAAILTALQALDEPLDDYVGPTALLREAQAGLKKAKFDKLDWLRFDALPRLKFKSGKTVPDEIPRWWIFLAFKLKQPGGNALFDIYLDQLDPESAEAFSSWVLDSWITYDTQVPSDEEANAYAEKRADQQFQALKRWMTDYTREDAFNDLRRQKKSEYLSSGAATKGILAFASRAPAQTAADRVRAYLKNHGSRTSQASSLLDVLAHKGDAVSLQVVIAAATRLKQKGVQAYAGTLVEAVADRMNWSMDELGDRVIPTAGLDDDGILELPSGPSEKLYQATLSEDYTLVLKNPDGKIVKALPAGTDDATKASKKQLTASKKELKQVVSMQSARLYEALCGARTWAVRDWQRDFRDHPVMRRLTERVVWEGLDANGAPQSCFRPTAEGEYTDAEDNPVEPQSLERVRIAHGAMLDADATALWETHLKDYEVKPLFPQFGRSLKTLDTDQTDKMLIEDRKGWALESFQLRGIATKLGYERGPAEDGGWFYLYRKDFIGVGLTAVIEFTGNCLPEENRSVALISLAFEKAGKRMHQKVKLGDVPKVLLSECWNDLYDMAAKGAHDPNWEKTCQW